jgi:hypothetical protein
MQGNTVAFGIFELRYEAVFADSLFRQKGLAVV